MTLRRAVSLGAALASSLVLGSASAANRCVDAATSAQDLRSQSKLVEARTQLVTCSQKSCNAVVRGDCERWLKEVDDATPTVIVRVVDPRGDVVGANVTIDDAPITLDGMPVPVDPGPRVLKVRASSGETMEQSALVAQGEKGRIIEIRFDHEVAHEGPPVSKPTPQAAPEAPSNVVPITLAAVGAAAVVSFVVFEALGQSGYSNLKDTCAKTTGCGDSDIDPVKTQFTIAGVSLIIAGVALAAAGVVYFTRKSSASPTAFAPVLRF